MSATHIIRTLFVCVCVCVCARAVCVCVCVCRVCVCVCVWLVYACSPGSGKPFAVVVAVVAVVGD